MFDLFLFINFVFEEMTPRMIKQSQPLQELLFGFFFRENLRM